MGWSTYTRATAAAGPSSSLPHPRTGGSRGAQGPGRAVGVVADRPAQRGAAFRVACQLAAYWMSRGMRVALRPSLRRPGPRGVPPGETPAPALLRWVGRYRQRAQFSVAYLAPLTTWAGAIGQALALFDRLVVVSSDGAGALEDRLRLDEPEAGRLVGMVVQDNPASYPPEVAVYLGGYGGEPAQFCGPEPLAVAYLACSMLAPPAFDAGQGRRT